MKHTQLNSIRSNHPAFPLVQCLRRQATILAGMAILVALLSACANPNPVPLPTPSLAKELSLYNWEEYMPQSVLDAFAAEYGVHVTYVTFESTEEAEANIRAGKVTFDVAVLDLDMVPRMAADGYLAEIDLSHVPNFKNISPNFRNLAFDPENRHSIPYNWGTTGLLVRSDLVEPPTRWADLWEPRYAGKIAVRAQPTELISVALKGLGDPLNSENPTELAKAGERLSELKPKVQVVGVPAEEAVAPLLSGQASILLGWSGDAVYAASQNDAIRYVLPEEGTMLWGDVFVISAKSPKESTAELFLNFLLRPEISAQIINTYSYPSANEAALKFVKPEIANNPVIYPSRDAIARAAWYQPLSPEAQKLYDAIWEKYWPITP